MSSPLEEILFWITGEKKKQSFTICGGCSNHRFVWRWVDFQEFPLIIQSSVKEDHDAKLKGQRAANERERLDETEREREHVSAWLCSKYRVQQSDKYSFQNINTTKERPRGRECKTGFFFFVGAERSLILHTLLFTPHTKLWQKPCMSITGCFRFPKI